jgi:hypothetical protein
LVAIDPGPDLPQHVDAILDALDGRPLAAIACTHTHRDHSPASRALKEATGAPIIGCAPLALESIGPVEAWRRLFAMIGRQKGSYAGYIGMKIVLAMAAGILMAIAGIILILILLIPAVIAALIAYFIFTGAGIGWNVLTITLAVAAAVVFAAVFVFVLAMASVPVVTFFQSYVLQFFGSRYDRLAALVYPEPPAAPPLPA